MVAALSVSKSLLVEDQLGTLVIDELKVQLKQALPDYMVPRFFLMLEAMPLNTNGKLDRKRLPAPTLNSALNREYEAPEGKVEIKVAEVWQELLGFGPISRNDHFFERGGHSLMAITLIQRLRECGLTVDVRTVFSAPTLSDMASTIVVNQGKNLDSDIPPNPLSGQRGQFDNSEIEEFRI